jgi:glycopeptide antibiotics resistance protein
MKKAFLAATIIIYLCVVAAFTIVPTHLSGFRSVDQDHINLVPLGYSFKCLGRTEKEYRSLRAACLQNTLGNVALFLPFGILLPLLSSRLRSLKRVMLVALGLSVSIEATQFVLRFVGNPRAVDIDDVLLNTLGACLGFAVYRLFRNGEGRKAEAADQGQVE